MNASLLHERVSAQAERTPDARALVMGERTLGYAELERDSNRLARLIREAGCREGDRVGLPMPKCPEAIVSMLGVLKAGCIYVPMDLDSPAPRIAHVVESAEPSLLIAHGRAVGLLGKLQDLLSLPPVLATDGAAFADSGIDPVGDFAGLAEVDDASVASRRRESDIAHILFTSGSTGLPKGVMITHRNVTSFLDWACDYFSIGEGERLSGHPPLHFDLSTFDIYGALSRGAELHLVPPEMNLFAPKLAAFIRERELEQWFSVPSILTYLANFDVIEDGDFPKLRRLLWCGEAIPTTTLIYWMRKLPHVTFTNLYGPTEATIASSYFTVPACPANEREAVPIGRPCAGEGLMVLDESLKPVPDGELGEIFISGVGLSPGYWRDEAKTQAAFVEIEDPDLGRQRIYRTGDLGLRDNDANFHYRGRLDSQIKSRGHRIELGEIEAALHTLGYLEESAVVGVEVGGFEGTGICCAYVADAAEDAAPTRIRKDLGEILPRYMLPAHWVSLDALPKNANGKIDRPALRTIFQEQLNASKQA